MSLKASVLTEFDPPGFPYVDDLQPQNKITWSRTRVSDWMQNEITATNDDGTPLQGPNGINRTPLDQFFNGTVTAFETGQKADPIHWAAFPKRVSTVYSLFLRNIADICQDPGFVYPGPAAALATCRCKPHLPR